MGILFTSYAMLFDFSLFYEFKSLKFSLHNIERHNNSIFIFIVGILSQVTINKDATRLSRGI